MLDKKITEKLLKLCNIFDSSEVGRDYSDIGQISQALPFLAATSPRIPVRLVHPELRTLLITKEPGYEAPHAHQ
jgi:hypothetical protein